ncbi:transporter substrate-binding domain-containing protein [Candidatus Liberibacter sp.]|uniref:transporter substrate-binding domain-containing protein n=1 Tax=Candidatus Liberibacter sp. TaxID=34022 RepID=UPI00217557BA|nr:transporter substrate-binding domain-containing protein [Candidatus Liberibacter sp.]
MTSKIDTKFVIRVGTDGIYPPHSFHSASGQGGLTGFDIELIEEIGRRLGATIEFFETKVNGLIRGIDINRYDILVNVAMTEERQNKYHFSIPYLSHDILLIVRSDEENIHRFQDVKGKRVVQMLGTGLFQMAQDLGVKVVTSDGFYQSIQLLLSGRADATMMPNIPFFDFLKHKPDSKGKFKIADQKKDSGHIAFMMRKGRDDLKKSIDETLCEMRSDGVYKVIFNKYFDDKISSDLPVCPLQNPSS